jgi:hypothetical protein
LTGHFCAYNLIIGSVLCNCSTHFPVKRKSWLRRMSDINRAVYTSLQCRRRPFCDWHIFWFWYVKPCTPLKVNFAKSIFNEIYNDLLQTRRTLHELRCEKFKSNIRMDPCNICGVSPNIFIAKMLIVEWQNFRRLGMRLKRKRSWSFRGTIPEFV